MCNLGQCLLLPAGFLLPLPECMKPEKDISIGKINIPEGIMHTKAKYVFSPLVSILNFAPSINLEN